MMILEITRLSHVFKQERKPRKISNSESSSVGYVATLARFSYDVKELVKDSREW